MNRNCFIGILSAVTLLAACSPSNAEEPSATKAAPIESIQVGKEFQPCDDCPTFVRVPDALEQFRPVRFVSKYELTWRNYIKAHEDAGCELTPIASQGKLTGRIVVELDRFRVDRPIYLNREADIECYVNWLSENSNLTLAIPTEDEWEWFARAGVSTNFPYGDEFDLAKSAIRTVENASVFYKPPSLRHLSGRLGHGAKVGQFSPNKWGLYDIVGNAIELTSTRFIDDQATSRKGVFSAENERVILKGLPYYTEEIPGNIFEHRTKSISYRGEIQWASLGLRLVVLEKGP